MAKIVVFDSGLGSLSIIKSIQKYTKSELIYFADQKNFPYGTKSVKELEKIIRNTISGIKQKFNPDLIVIGSNTPSLLLDKLFLEDPTLIGVFPPLIEAQILTKTNSVALLVTRSVAKSRALDVFIKKNLRKKVNVVKINISDLIELVESGKFIYKKQLCKKKIIEILNDKLTSYDIDVATLSSTHLPFLLPFLQEIFPDVKFLNPSDSIAMKIIKHKYFSTSKRNSLKIFSSGNINSFQKKLNKIGIRKIVNQIKFE